MAHLHSVPARARPEPCGTIGGPVHPGLRPYVIGYAGFRSGDGTAVAHRVLPVNTVTMIVDYEPGGRVVTGARATPAVFERTRWGHGVSVGLTPLGVGALLGVPMGELAGATVPLADLLGHAGEHLAERLDAAPDWPSRFTVLDAVLAARLGRHLTDPARAGRVPDAAPGRHRADAGLGGQIVDATLGRRVPDAVVLRAWARLQGAGAPRVGALAADLGVSRRSLEVRFRRQLGLPPATVARIARFQRAVWMLARGRGLPATALDSGYADQPHFNREIRAMAGLTPTRLCALLQYRELAPR